MVGSNSVGNVLHEDCLTSLWLRHDEGTLTFSDRCEEIYDTCGEVGGLCVATEGVLLVGEEWGKMLERYAVAYLGGLFAVYLVNTRHWEVLLAVVWRAHLTLNNVAGLQSVALYLLNRNIHVVGT